VPFEKLDFGQTDSLDKFYNADVAIVDMYIQVQQSAVSYHVGVRESWGMPETVITVHDINPEFTLSLKVQTILCYYMYMSLTITTKGSNVY
jgi:mitogen-activated protein kinase kinase kinase 5